MERIEAEYAWATALPFWLQPYIWFAYIVGWSTVDIRKAYLERRFAERDAAVAAILTSRLGEDVARIIASMSIECTTFFGRREMVHVVENHANGMVLYINTHNGWGIDRMEAYCPPSPWNARTRYGKYWQLSEHGYGYDVDEDQLCFKMPTSMYCRWLNTLPNISKKHIPLDDFHIALLLKGSFS